MSGHETCLDISHPGRVHAGAGCVARLPEILARLGAQRVLILTDAGVTATGMIDRLRAALDRDTDVTVHDAIPANPTTDAVDAAANVARAARAQAIVAIGGGSPLDAAKPVAWLASDGGDAAGLDGAAAPEHPPVPIVAIPTTAGTGAETNGFGVIENSAAQVKVYLGHDSTAPTEIILDPDLTLGLPEPVTAATGFDALIHAVESLTSRGASPFSRAWAAESLRLTTESLPRVVADGSDVGHRYHQLLAAHLAGRALTLSGLGLVHGLAHALTAMTGTPHGVALAAFAEPAIAIQAPHHPDLYGSVAQLWRIDDRAGSSRSGSARAEAERVAAAVGELGRTIGVVHPLTDLGLAAPQVPELVAKALADPVTTNTPYRPSTDELHELVRNLL